jgi:hypothetical protein
MARSTPSFEEDMRLIREKQEVSRETLHAQTKIALENIELFERGELEQHPHFNDVYVRALVRAYADVLDISTERALQGLEQARQGTYTGALGNVYLDRPTPAEEDVSGTETGAVSGEEGTTDDAGLVRGENLQETDEEQEKPSSSAPTELAEEGDGSEPSGQTSGSEDVARTSTTAGTSKQYGRASEGGARAGLRGRSWVREWLASSGTSTILFVAVVVILLVLVFWLFTVLLPGSSVLSDQEGGDSDPAETISEEVAAVPVQQQSPPVATIGDSLDFTIIAATDKLEPIRVRLDAGSWNPYWVEQGDSLSFAAEETFTLRDYLPRARLRVESLEWPLEATGQYDTLAVSRQQVQQHIDSLTVSSSR